MALVILVFFGRTEGVAEKIRRIAQRTNFLFALRPIHSKLGRVNLNPEKLLLSKWTAVNPQAREKHFLVVRVINPETDRHKIEEVEMEAVMTRRRFTIRWEELQDASRWVQGWTT